MMNMDRLYTRLSIDEGRKKKLYRDTVGKLSGGVGRNFDDVDLADDEIDLMLKNDVNRAISLLDRNIPWWRGMDGPRQEALVNMCFNMGWGDGRKGLSSFINTLAKMKTGDYAGAADGMLASKWAVQVGARAQRLAKIMRDGE